MKKKKRYQQPIAEIVDTQDLIGLLILNSLQQRDRKELMKLMSVICRELLMLIIVQLAT